MGRSAQKTKHLRSRRACPFPSTCSIKKVWVDGLDKCLNWEPAGRPISFMSTSVQSFVVLFCELSDQLTLRIEASGWWLVRDGAWRSKLGFPLRSHGCSFHLRGRFHCPCYARKGIAFTCCALGFIYGYDLRVYLQSSSPPVHAKVNQ